MDNQLVEILASGPAKIFWVLFDFSLIPFGSFQSFLVLFIPFCSSLLFIRKEKNRKEQKRTEKVQKGMEKYPY